MNELTAFLLYFVAILLAIAYTAALGRWVQARHNELPARGCASLAGAVGLTAFLTWLVFRAIN